MKFLPYLVAALLLSMVLVNWWNNTRKPVDFIVLDEGTKIGQIANEYAIQIGTSCIKDGYFTLQRHTFMCVYLGENYVKPIGGESHGQSKR